MGEWRTNGTHTVEVEEDQSACRFLPSRRVSTRLRRALQSLWSEDGLLATGDDESMEFKQREVASVRKRKEEPVK